MPFFVKKPIAAEARQFTGEFDDNGLRSWMSDAHVDINKYAQPGEYVFMIRTNSGWQKVWAGDWIIKGVDGEFYPCPKAVFEASYEPAPEPETMAKKGHSFFTLNGRKLEARSEFITYEALVALAFKNPRPGGVYSVTWRHKRHGCGTLLPADSLYIFPDTVINICITGAA